MNTCLVTRQAAARLNDLDTKVYMDSGVENQLLECGSLQRIIARIDVTGPGISTAVQMLNHARIG